MPVPLAVKTAGEVGATCMSNEFEVRPTYSTSNVTLVRPATSYGTTALICEATEISGAYALIPEK
jgi:hypothetical protein